MNKMKYRYLFTLLILLVFNLLIGCNEGKRTTPVARRSPPPPPPPAPAVVSPEPTPVPIVEQKPGPAPVPVVKPKPVVKKPAPKPVYVVLQSPIGVLGPNRIDILEKADIKSNVIAQVVPGTKLELLTTQGTWMKVKTPNGKTGWISSSYVKK